MGKVLSGVVLAVSLISLFISLKLFYNMGVFVDEFGTNPSVVCGGDFWLLMDWLRLGLLFTLCIISLIGLFKRERGTREL